VRATDRQVQKALGIEQRTSRFPEVTDHRADGGFSRARTVRMTAHAVDDREKRGAVGARDRNPILVLFAVSEQAQICVLEVQGRIRHACFSGKLPALL
jgi:hypothetical protein